MGTMARPPETMFLNAPLVLWAGAPVPLAVYTLLVCVFV